MMENAPLLELEFDAFLEGDVEEPKAKRKKKKSKNTMGEMMKHISLKARLSKTYTNHCVRASCITRLSSSGVPDSVIMSTSGHKSVKSLATYNRTTEKQAAITAAVLDHDVVKQRSITAGAQTDDDDQDDVDEALALALPEQLAELEKPNASITDVRPASATPGPVPATNFAGASFSGCTFHFSVPNQV